MSPARAQERRDASPILIPLGVLSGAAALWFGLPGLVLIWLALALAGFMHPAPPKPKASEKDDPWVQESRQKHQFFSTMAYTLIAPNKGGSRLAAAVFLLRGIRRGRFRAALASVPPRTGGGGDR